MSDSTFQTILALETATPVQALALVDGDDLREHRVQRVRYNHGSSLLKNVDQLLSARNIDLDSIDLFAIGLGPGSFTGLRVGLATAKALSRAVNKPIVGVSSLAALAFGPAKMCGQATVLATIDARRREIYAGAYTLSTDGQTLVSAIDEQALAPDDFIAAVDDTIDGPLILVGDGPEKYLALRQWDSPDLTWVPAAIAPPSAVGVALLGRHLAQTQGPADRIALEPNYIRPSDAVLPAQAPGPMPPEPTT